MNILILCVLVGLFPDYSRAFTKIKYTDLNVQEGEDVELQCRKCIFGHRQEATWYREGGRPMPERHQITDGYLHLVDVKKEDAGTYYCKGYFGFTIESTQITIRPRPAFQLTPHERQIYRCLQSKGWGDERMKDYYNRVLNWETRSGRASLNDQRMVRGCLTIEDFLDYGVDPESFTTTTTAPPPDTFSDVTIQERKILLCLRDSGMSDQHIRAWYNRVLNPATRSGRVSKRDQDLAMNCIQPADYPNYVSPDGYSTTTTTTTPAPATTTTTYTTTTQSVHLTAATPREQKMFDCLKAKNWTDLMIQQWYKRVLTPETRTGRATRYDQDMVGDCVNTEDYLYYGVSPDGYTTTTTTTTQTPTTTIPLYTTTTQSVHLKAATPREQKIFDCLKAKNWTDLMIQQWYDRVLNPTTTTRSGRATRYDQDMVGDCVNIDDYLYYGVTPDGYTPTTSSSFGEIENS